ncbi:hypothetical protein ISN45_At02g006930 [Arabidopsis thaliana x Arabidopsis arenosa]|jgi:hypothetical protein|nr:hypothetical protein ISN45_At02g006930 [Arabidopsis thaliana x Arabidopsis arenosa]KAG7640733.1 hypothetical protein ISN44_As02g007070 [Arabidopsis suecica]
MKGFYRTRGWKGEESVCDSLSCFKSKRSCRGMIDGEDLCVPLPY